MSATFEPKALPSETEEDMVWIAGGTFRMGSDEHYPEEAPAHLVHVDGFWVDRTPVTNREFRRFVEATGYLTVAERGPEAKDYPGALPHMLKAGSLVFVPPGRPVTFPLPSGVASPADAALLCFEDPPESLPADLGTLTDADPTVVFVLPTS